MLGIEVLDVSPGRAVARMQVSPSMRNSHGMCHGGYVFTLADTAFEHACNADRPATVAAAATIEFLAATPAGATLTATCTERWRRGRGGIYDVEVVDGDGVTVALFRGRSRTTGDGPSG